MLKDRTVVALPSFLWRSRIWTHDLQLYKESELAPQTARLSPIFRFSRNFGSESSRLLIKSFFKYFVSLSADFILLFRFSLLAKWGRTLPSSPISWTAADIKRTTPSTPSSASSHTEEGHFSAFSAFLDFFRSLTALLTWVHQLERWTNFII